VINNLGSNNGGLGAADFDFYFGNPGDKPFTGDFNDNGQDTVGLHRESTGFVYYRNTLTTGIADNAFFFGNPGDQIITGRWAQNPNPGPDTVGIFRPSDGRFYLRFSNSQGNANVDFAYGNSDMAAVAGEFGSFPPPTGNVLSISGTQFLLDGAPFDMWGVRVSSASQDQALTNDLISNLDDYLAHGVNTITVFYMGSSGGSDDPFSNDGTSIDAGDQSRMLQIIDAADQRNMVVVVGIFYQKVVAADKNLSGWTASQEAVRTVVNALEASGYRNVIINIANEQNSSSYSDDPWSRVRNTVDLIAMCNIVHTEAPGLLCGGGGYDKTRNDDIAASADIDAVLMDNCKGCGSDTGLEMYDDLAAQGLNTKPIVNVEQFGGWTKNFLPPGVFPQTEKDAYFVEVDDALAQSGLYTFLHNNPWFQGPSTGNPVRFDLAGLGTSGDPGVAWYFEYVSETVLGL
jgi:hypothetical protein